MVAMIDHTFVEKKPLGDFIRSGKLKKEKLEDFKAAISSTVRSLSNSEKIEVLFGNQNSKSSNYSIKLPDS